MKAVLFRQTLKVALLEMHRVLTRIIPTASVNVQIHASDSKVTFISDCNLLTVRIPISGQVETPGSWTTNLGRLAEAVSDGDMMVTLDAITEVGILKVSCSQFVDRISALPTNARIGEELYGGPWHRRVLLNSGDLRVWSALRRIVALGEPGTLLSVSVGSNGVIFDLESGGISVAYHGKPALVHSVAPDPFVTCEVTTKSIVSLSADCVLVETSGAQMAFKSLPGPKASDIVRPKVKEMTRATRGVLVDVGVMNRICQSAYNGAFDPPMQTVAVSSGRQHLSLKYNDAFPWDSEIAVTDGVEQWEVVVRLRELLTVAQHWDSGVRLCVNRADPETPLLFAAVGGEAKILIAPRQAHRPEAKPTADPIPHPVEDLDPP